MKTDNSRPIKDDIIVIVKESIKFALVAITLLLGIGTLLMYILVRFTEIDREIGAMLVGVIVAIFIVVVDDKKFHTVNKITDCNMRIIRKVLKI